MNIRILIGIIGVFLLGFSRTGSGAVTQTGSGEPLQYRSFDPEKVNDLLQDEDFAYKKKAGPQLNFWNRFISWLQKMFRAIFGTGPSAQEVEYFIYAVCLVVFIWAVARLIGIEMNAVFAKKPATVPLPYKVNEEDIHTIDFEAEIGEAVTRGQWRMVIRLQYLFALKKLSDAGIIEVHAGKTNHDYLYEVQREELIPPFRRLSQIFEYTWYGQFEVKPEILREAEEEFSSLKSRIQIL